MTTTTFILVIVLVVLAFVIFKLKPYKSHQGKDDPRGNSLPERAMLRSENVAKNPWMTWSPMVLVANTNAAMMDISRTRGDDTDLVYTWTKTKNGEGLYTTPSSLRTQSWYFESPYAGVAGAIYMPEARGYLASTSTKLYVSQSPQRWILQSLPTSSPTYNLTDGSGRYLIPSQVPGPQAIGFPSDVGASSVTLGLLRSA